MRNWLKRLLWALPWLLAVGLFLFVLRFVSFTAVIQTIQHLQFWQLFLLIGLNAIILVLLTGRWWLLLRGLGQLLPFGLTFGHRLAAFGVTYLTPGPQFGGEPVQVLLIEKVNGVPRVTAVSSVSLDKTVELLVNFAFLVSGVLLALQFGLFGDAVGAELLLVTAVLLLFPVLYLIGLWRGQRPLSQLMRITAPVFNFRLAWRTWFDTAVQGMARSEKQTGQFCHHAPQTMLLALFVSIIGWGFMVIEYGLLLTFLGAELTAVEIIIMMTAARLAYLLPLPSGLGSLEASQVFTLNLLGQPAAVGVTAVLLIRSRDLLLALVVLWWGSWFLRRAIQEQ